VVKPTLVSIVALGGRDDGALLALAAGAARGLKASLGTAILESARERDVEIATLDRLPESVDAGVVASINGTTVVVGTAALLASLGLSVAAFGGWPERLQQRGQQILFVAVDGRAAGFIGVIDADCKQSQMPASSEQTQPRSD
jgi:P-type Cu+ transporter